MKILSAIAVSMLLLVLMGYIDIVLTANMRHKDCLAGPMMGIVAMLALVLGVGLTEAITTKNHGEKP